MQPQCKGLFLTPNADIILKKRNSDKGILLFDDFRHMTDTSDEVLGGGNQSVI